MFATPQYRDEKVLTVSCRPDYLSKRALGQQVKGLSYCGDKSCAFEGKVQTGDFEDSTFCGVVGGKPLLSLALRKFKRFHHNVDGFVT